MCARKHRNFRETNHKCCGNCKSLTEDEMSGHYYCQIELDGDELTTCYEPGDPGEMYRYVCDEWS